MIEDQDRYARQLSILPLENLARVRATVVGVGAVGRQVALQLVTMGVPWIQLVDFDTVEASNLASQGYWDQDLGRLKTNATSDVMKLINQSMPVFDITPDNGCLNSERVMQETDRGIFIQSTKFKKSSPRGDHIFCCVDGIETRKFIWEAVKNSVRFYADSRMAASVLRVLSVTLDNGGRSYYPTTFFAQADALPQPCTAKTTIYCANVIAGLLVSQFANFLRGIPVEKELGANLLTQEFEVK